MSIKCVFHPPQPVHGIALAGFLRGPILCRAAAEDGEIKPDEGFPEQNGFSDSLLRRPRSSFVKMRPAEDEAPSRPRLCFDCTGSGRIPCQSCKGFGYLPKGGYQVKTSIRSDRLLKSRWTAMADTVGWRHFEAVQVRKDEKKAAFVLLQVSYRHRMMLLLVL